MKITYIHHSAFLMEVEDASFLFDYTEGKLTELEKDKPLFVFASHFHADHFDPAIFDLSNGRDDVTYILSKEIRKKGPFPVGEEHILYVSPNQTYSLAEDIVLDTFKSTDEGVAFWLHAGKKEIYHAGDLNDWWWEGESKAWNHNMAASYKHEMDKLKGRHADVACVPLDPRLEQWFYLGMKEFMDVVEADLILPMHFWGDYSVIEKMKAHESSEAFRDRIAGIKKEGQIFYSK